MRRLTLLLALALSLALSACSPSQSAMTRKFIYTAADAQIAVGNAYETASYEQAIAIGRCKSEANARGIQVYGENADEKCSEIGAALPYPLSGLENAAKPIQALKSAVAVSWAAYKVQASEPDKLPAALSELALALVDVLRLAKVLPVRDQKAVADARMLVIVDR